MVCQWEGNRQKKGHCEYGRLGWGQPNFDHLTTLDLICSLKVWRFWKLNSKEVLILSKNPTTVDIFDTIASVKIRVRERGGEVLSAMGLECCWIHHNHHSRSHGPQESLAWWMGSPLAPSRSWIILAPINVPRSG